MSNREEKTQREDQALNRALAWFGGAVVVEALILLVKRYYVDYWAGEAGIALFLLKLFPILAVVAAVACVGGVFWSIQSAKQGKKLTLPAVLTIVAAVIAVCSTVFALFVGDGVKAMLVLVPVVAVLALVYYLYQKEFFVVAVSGAAALFALGWMRQEGWSVKVYLLGLVALIVICLCIVLVLHLKKEDGVLTLAGKRIRVFSKQANYVPILVVCGAMALTLLAALLLGATAAYYLMFVVVALLFIMAVYYTVKLM
jgi:hypothetical protein